MSKTMKFTLIHVCSWTLVGLFMIMIFLNPSTIEQWGDNRNKTILLASLFILGYSTDLILLLFEKSKKFGFKRDERDFDVQRKATNIGFIIALVYVFFAAITLYTKYESKGLMPVGWMWFLAYSTVIIANLSVSVPSLLLYRKQEF